MDSELFDGIVRGLQEALDYNQGKIKARVDKISIQPPPVFEADEIKKIRNELGMTQFIFAGVIGVSPKTIEAWESGRNTPEGPARRILGMVQADPGLPERFHIVAR